MIDENNQRPTEWKIRNSLPSDEFLQHIQQITLSPLEPQQPIGRKAIRAIK